MIATTREDWEDLLALSQSESAARPLLERLLEHWCRLHRAEAAALYLERGALLERECTHGPREFPDFYDPAAPAAEFARGLALFRLPGGALVFAPGEIPLADAATLLLSEASKASRLSRQLKEQRFQANYRGVELEALYDVGLKVASTLDLEELSEEILLHAVMLLDARRGALYLFGPGGYKVQRTFGGEAAESFAAGDSALARFLAGEPGAPDSLLPGARHLLGVPIEIEGSPRGLIAVGDKESRRGVGPFRASDRRSLGLFANQAAIALENARLHLQALEKERLEREMSLAAEIQRQILPKGAPEIPGYELAGWNRPALQVGGDYYGFLELPGDRLGLSVGDVSGKGMPAALLVSTLHSALRLLLERNGVGPDFLERLNGHLADSSTANKFVTLFFAELDPGSGELGYLNAGHNPGLILRRDGTLEELGSGGVPLGLIRAAQFREQKTAIHPGDLLCLYSDGITEACSPDDEEFGLERLGNVLTDCRDQPLPDLIQAIERATTAFAEGYPQGDDQTVVLLRRAG
ncbi:MAG TPA: SpoIIE family protein phosphatase [Thermoanaerobaculia bacterium]|nr:SpoIIE family protein phosphatase [Thermoanaerobaculia bacterium]